MIKYLILSELCGEECARSTHMRHSVRFQSKILEIVFYKNHRKATADQI